MRKVIKTLPSDGTYVSSKCYHANSDNIFLSWRLHDSLLLVLFHLVDLQSRKAIINKRVEFTKEIEFKLYWN